MTTYISGVKVPKLGTPLKDSTVTDCQLISDTMARLGPTTTRILAKECNLELGRLRNLLTALKNNGNVFKGGATGNSNGERTWFLMKPYHTPTQETVNNVNEWDLHYKTFHNLVSLRYE